MRKNSARKLLHATLDLLPLIVIPIFGLYYFNHAIDEPLSVTTSGYEITPLYETNDVNSLDDLLEGNVYHLEDLNLDDTLSTDVHIYFHILKYESCVFDYGDAVLNDFIFQEYDSNFDNYLGVDFYAYFNNEFTYYFYTNSTNNSCYTSVEWRPDNVSAYYFDFHEVDFYISGGTLNDFKVMCEEWDYLPTRSDFQSYNVEYSEGIVYNDTDVGSQFIYSLYHVTDKYFNFTNVANFKDLWNWIQYNMFGGVAPLSIYIVYNIVLYELLMDLVMLVYLAFMFIVDFINGLFNKFSKKVGGD